MITRPKFKCGAFESIHNAAAGLHRAAMIDKATTRDFDESFLAKPPKMSPENIKRIREQVHVSQPIFARYLNTRESTVQKWDAGTKRPSGMALKLLAVVETRGPEVLN
jgi:putative transcriptional regulator